MVWSSFWPDGSKSVKQNTGPGQQNTTYIKTTQNNDHFWDIGTDEDGYHRRVSMERYSDTAIGAPTDAPIPTGMDGVYYLKQANSRIAGFYRNASGIFQSVPGFITGNANITTSYQNILVLPDNCYGQVWLFKSDDTNAMGFGSFKCSSAVCQAYCVQTLPGNTSTPQLPFRFGSADQVDGLNFRVRVSDAPQGVYQYRFMFWEI